MGVVYYGNYFVWFEVARTEYLRNQGISYERLEESGLYLMVVSASCKYKATARYDEVVSISTWVSSLRNTSLTFEYELSVGSKQIASGESCHVFTDKAYKPVRIPESIKRLKSLQV